MSELVVIGFEDPQKAAQTRDKLVALQAAHLIDLEDAVVAVREADGNVQLNQVYPLSAVGALTGGFWGTLVGLMFLNPLFGMLAGAAAGAVSGALSDAGIDDRFMKELSLQLQPGSSALFVLVRRAATEKVLAELKPFEGRVLRTSLSHEDEARLRNALDAARHASVQTRELVGTA
jgi:uncharacterized membrane protein